MGPPSITAQGPLFFCDRLSIVGSGSGKLIAEATLAVEMAAVAADIAETIHPHPALSESASNSAEIYDGTSTDLYMPMKK